MKGSKITNAMLYRGCSDARDGLLKRAHEYDAHMYYACSQARDGLLKQSKEYAHEALEYGKKVFRATCHKRNAWRAERVGTSRPEKYCCRCGEDFPRPEEPAEWTKEEMRSLEHASFDIRYMLPHGVDGSHGGGYLCGGCYFDLTDEE